MKKIKSLFFIAVASLLLTACSVSRPVTVTDNEVGEKTGKASYTVILGIFRPFDANAGIAKAAENGDIDKIATVDRKVKSGLFSTTFTTIVTGK